MPKFHWKNPRQDLLARFSDHSEKRVKSQKVKDLLIASSAIANDLVVVARDRGFEIFKSFGLKTEIL